MPHHTPDPAQGDPPPDWRALLAALPDEDGPPPGTPRRRWRRTQRQAARTRRAGATAELRRQPLGPAAVLLVVLVVLVLGVVARHSEAPQPADNRPAPAAAPPAPPAAAPSRPEAAPSLAPAAGPDDVAGAWTRAYLSRDPWTDRTHKPAARRAAPWATPELTRNLTETTPPGWGRQVSRGESTTVRSVAVRPAGPDLPPDNPAQVWRTVTASVDVTGYESSRRTDTVQVEVMRTVDGWRVSRVLGV